MTTAVIESPVWKDTLTHWLRLSGKEKIISINNLTVFDNKKQIEVDVSKLVSDAELRIKIINMPTMDLIKFIISPMTMEFRPDEIRVDGDDTIVFWWD
jgi:hypothetical protein